MAGKKLSIGVLVVILVFGQVLIGCTSAPSAAGAGRYRSIEMVPWVGYTLIPSKDYTVVGVVILREVDPATLSTDLMEKAAEMGAHDIINVRVDEERMVDEEGRTRKRVVAVSAVAIRYTNVTLTPELHESLMPKTDNQTETPYNNQQSPFPNWLPGKR
jgi:hypothetical protein